jgi:MFS superfamily sulfate permease-like transporter
MGLELAGTPRRWSSSILERENAPLHLVAATAVATTISVTAFEILMGLSVIVLIAMRKRWHVPPVWPPLALFMLGTLVSLAASGHVRQGLPQIKKFVFVYQPERPLKSAFLKISLDKRCGFRYRRVG